MGNSVVKTVLFINCDAILIFVKHLFMQDIPLLCVNYNLSDAPDAI